MALTLISAAGPTHVARDRRPIVVAVDDEVVALGLATDGLGNGGVDEVVALGGAQRCAQISSVVLSEAHVERACAGEAHPVAAFAEIVGERRDEAEAATGFLDAHITGRTTGFVGNVVQRELVHQLRAQH